MKERIRATSAGIAPVCLLVAGSLSAGIHAGLAPEHLREWPPLGAAFVAAAVILSAAVAACAIRPASPRPAQALALLLAGMIAAYAATRLFALPPLDPAREPLDALGLTTTAIEAAGVLLALRVSRRPPTRTPIQLALSPGGTR